MLLSYIILIQLCIYIYISHHPYVGELVIPHFCWFTTTCSQNNIILSKRENYWKTKRSPGGVFGSFCRGGAAIIYRCLTIQVFDYNDIYIYYYIILYYILFYIMLYYIILCYIYIYYIYIILYVHIYIICILCMCTIILYIKKKNEECSGLWEIHGNPWLGLRDPLRRLWCLFTALYWSPMIWETLRFHGKIFCARFFFRCFMGSMKSWTIYNIYIYVCVWYQKS